MILCPELQAIAPVYARIAKAIDRRTLATLERFARRMEPALRDAFLAAVRDAKNKMTLSLVEEALRQLNPAAAIRAASGGLEFEKMRETLADIVEASGVRSTQALTRMTGENIASFNMSNPYAANYARSEVGRMISGITDTTLQGIRRLIEAGIEEGIDVRTTARSIRSMIGLTEQQTNWVMNYEYDLLQRGSVSIDEKVERYANKLIRNRAQTIARTESLDAMNAGQQAAWRAAVDQDMLPKDVEQIWIVSDDERLCEICAPMEDQTAPMGGYFQTGDGRQVRRPPEPHPRCRCTVALNL